MPDLGYATDHCECTGCGQFFNSTYAFDKHRVRIEGDDPDNELRRCLTTMEMEAKGWSKNRGGFWITSSSTRTFGDRAA